MRRGWGPLVFAVILGCGAESGEDSGQNQRSPGQESVRRNPFDVTLVLEDGSTVLLRADTTWGDRYVRYEDAGLIETLNAHLVAVTFYESTGFMLIHHRTGDTTWVVGPPVVSPDARRFVATSLDLIAQLDFNTLQIFKVSMTGFEEEYQVSPEDWGPSDATWISDDTVAFSTNVVNERLEYEQAPARLVRRGGEWVLILPDGESSGA